ncbi:MAG TPA: thioesterase family protein [Candidatus Eremiobacteraceae bacterium]|nr:thioesterase family protein [Candidatus Eremiobacteraceae bacterium]
MNADLSRFKFVRPVTVVFRDIDGLRHVNHAAYLTYCETARNEYWMRVCELSGVEDFDFVLAELTVRYHAAAKLGDELLVGCRVTDLRRSSFLMELQIVDANSHALVAEVNSVQVMYDFAAERSIPISDLRRAQVEAFEGKTLTTAPKRATKT